MKLVKIVIICLLIGFYFHDKEKAQEAIYKVSDIVTNIYHISTPVSSTSVSSTQASSTQAPSTPADTNTSEHTNIEKTLHLVAENYQRIDVNGDGLNNCIDAAVLFYQYFPDKNKVRIMINRNSKTGMHHLFNSVYTDGVWKTIEPQAYAHNHSNYSMQAVWENMYNNSYNRDATQNYIKYVRD